MPAWDVWRYKGSIPNNTAAGIYAIFDKDDKIIYIGMADGEGQPGYEKHSLGNRLSRVWRLDRETTAPIKERVYLRDPDWEEAGSLATLPVTDRTKEGHHDFTYMVYSLEVYLIRKLCPERNIRSKRKPEEQIEGITSE